MKIAVIGSKGMVGSAIMKFWNSPLVRGRMTDSALARLPEDELFPFDLPEFDVSSRLFTRDGFDTCCPDVMINASGINLIDWLEIHPNTARTIHVQGAANLRDVAKKRGALLVQLGCAEIFYSDVVDKNRRPWTETDLPNPASVFAQTKLDAERAASESPRHLIVRVPPLFGTQGEQGGGNLVETVLKASRRSQMIQVINEIVTSPTFTLDLLRALYYLVQTGVTGCYHVAGSNMASLDEIARFLLDACGLKRHEIKGIPLADYGYRAPRSIFTPLNAARYHALPNAYPIPRWQDALREFLDLRSNGGQAVVAR